MITRASSALPVRPKFNDPERVRSPRADTIYLPIIFHEKIAPLTTTAIDYDSNDDDEVPSRRDSVIDLADS